MSYQPAQTTKNRTDAPRKRGLAAVRSSFETELANKRRALKRRTKEPPTPPYTPTKRQTASEAGYVVLPSGTTTHHPTMINEFERPAPPSATRCQSLLINTFSKFMGLPLELRDLIWEAALLTKVTPQEVDPFYAMANIFRAQLYSLELPPVANACHEALRAAHRLRKKDPTIFAHQETIFLVFTSKTGWFDAVSSLLEDGKQVVLCIDSTLQQKWSSSPFRGPNGLNDQLLSLLTAARDHQIKVCTPDIQRFLCYKQWPTDKFSEEIEKDWIGQKRLVGLDDLEAWRLLHRLEHGVWSDGDLIDGVLKKNHRLRRKYVDNTWRALQKCWRNENRRRKARGMKPLRWLPHHTGF